MSATTASTNGRIETYEDFVKVHGILLAASGLPQSLHFKLFEKLTSETFDGGAHFEIEPCEDGRQRRLFLTSDTLPKESDVFLIDHAWTFRLPDAYKQLQEVPGLAQRMAALMCVDVDEDAGSEEAVENGGKMTVEEVLESEIRNARENGDGVVRWLELEELGLDDDTLLSLDFDRDFEDAIIRGCPKLEICNSRFTRNFGEWALGFCADIYGKDNPGSCRQGDPALQNVTSLDLSNRSIHNLINKAFSPFEMPNLSHLNIRGNPIEENSVSDLVGILKAFYCLQSLEVDISGPLGESAVEILESLPTLSSLNGVDASKILETEKHVVDSMLQPRLPEWSSEEPLADRVLNAMWLYLMTYRLADEEKLDETPVWYVMDELGSALRHSDEPNFRVAPFLFMPDGKFASAEYEKHRNKLQSKSLPSVPIKPSTTTAVRRSDGGALRVYTDIPQVEEFLTRPEFAITNEPKEADIIWTSVQVDEEMKKAAQGSPGWLQPTYNLETHLSELIGDYCLRKKDGLNNLWILKPWNMARTIDTTVTDNLSAIIRLMETGPKICQKYIEHPALFRGKKFDLRYIVLVRSINPLEIFLSDVFWVRLANNPYSLEKHSLFEYETHFTVMNYGGRRLNHVNTPEFVREFEKEHQVKWLDIHQRVKSMIRSVFESAAAVHPEMHDPKSRAMYGVDVMLDDSFQPKLLEVTYCPDCMRACKYDIEAIFGGGEVIRGRDFFNFVFGCLFLNETNYGIPGLMSFLAFLEKTKLFEFMELAL
ncbi:Tubulin-tyrosine ligase [Corchorus olitorius]|uniref:Tubulin-tyrosine ligase n=1 Tax=Corchorus olitorius TaxID=93759 RepID=A0A1R3JAD6_9ROSI|nr:Tubulin-tyrosine ligase [Corchorus olitorius]